MQNFIHLAFLKSSMAANTSPKSLKSHNSFSICHKDIILGSTHRFISTRDLLQGLEMWFGHCISIRITLCYTAYSQSHLHAINSGCSICLYRALGPSEPQLYCWCCCKPHRLHIVGGQSTVIAPSVGRMINTGPDGPGWSGPIAADSFCRTVV